MQLEKKIKTETYRYEGGYLIDVVSDKNSGFRSAYMYKEYSEYKLFLFSQRLDSAKQAEFLEQVRSKMGVFIPDYDQWVKDMDERKEKLSRNVQE